MKILDGITGGGGGGSVPVKPGSGRERDAVAATRRFNAGQAAGAALMMVLGALAAFLLLADRDAEITVWEVAQDVSAGTALSAADLVPVEIAADTPVATVSTAVDLVGVAALIDMPAGTLLNASMVSGQPMEQVTQARVALVLEPDQHPEGVAPGDTLHVFELPVRGIDELGFERREDPYVVTVVSIQPSPGQSNRDWITVLVALDESQRLTTVSSLGLISAVKVG